MIPVFILYLRGIHSLALSQPDIVLAKQVKSFATIKTFLKMARFNNNLLLIRLRGKIADGIIVKQYDYGTVISKMPDMSRVKKTELQKLYQGKFAKAVAYAQSIIRHRKKKSAYAKKLSK
jgi:hypothetical protein